MASKNDPEAIVMLRLKGWGHKKGKKGRMAKYSFMLKEEDMDQPIDEEAPVKISSIRTNPMVVPG